jgi:hypothetical protein
VRLLEEALQALGAEDSLLRVMTLGGLARALGVTGAQHQALGYAEQAVAMARRLADPELLATSLDAMVWALPGPEHVRQRLTYATEMLHATETANAKEQRFEALPLSFFALYWRALCLLELGDMPAADSAISWYARLSEERQLSFHLCIVIEFRATRALMQGRFADSERLAQEALAIGQRCNRKMPPASLDCRCLPCAGNRAASKNWNRSCATSSSNTRRRVLGVQA